MSSFELLLTLDRRRVSGCWAGANLINDQPPFSSRARCTLPDKHAASNTGPSQITSKARFCKRGDIQMPS